MQTGISTGNVLINGARGVPEISVYGATFLDAVQKLTQLE